MKKIILGVAAIVLSASAFSQEKAIKNYGFGDNWFLQGQLGGSYTFSENHTRADFSDRITPHVAISVGKYFSPIAGARLQLGGWESKSYAGLDKSYKYNYFQTNLDGLLNLTNLFTPYQGDKAFNLYGILGIAYVHNFGDSEVSEANVATRNSVVPRVGLQADFRITSDLSLNLEAAANLMPDQFNGIVGGRKNDATLNTLIGLTYRFNSAGFELVDVVDPSEIQSLNDQINAQRAKLKDKDKDIQKYQAEIARLAAQPAPVVKEVKGETEVLMNAVVVFRLGSAKLEQNQDINIYNAAKYLQENPDVKVVVTGFADKATGTPAINQRLSEQRAQAVADILTHKYGIAANRIKVQASGDKEQPFDINEWNRVVVFSTTN